MPRFSDSNVAVHITEDALFPPVVLGGGEFEGPRAGADVTTDAIAVATSSNSPVASSRWAAPWSGRVHRPRAG